MDVGEEDQGAGFVYRKCRPDFNGVATIVVAHDSVDLTDRVPIPCYHV